LLKCCKGTNNVKKGFVKNEHRQELIHEPPDSNQFILPLLHNRTLEQEEKILDLNKFCPAICCHVLSPTHRGGGAQ
jgi:hypothetical protein